MRHQQSFRVHNSTRLIVVVLFCCLGFGNSWSQETGAKSEAELAATEASLSERYDRLELLAGRLAEFSKATQPRRAELLQQLVASSREKDLPGRFEAIVEALKTDSLGDATEGQTTLHAELSAMLELLLQEDRDRQIESERQRISKYLAELNKLIRQQRGIKARTDGGDSEQELSEDQQRTTDSTGELGAKIEATEGKPKSKADEEEKSGEQLDKSDKNDNKPGEDSKGEPKDSDSKDPSKQGDKSSGKPSESQSGENKPSDAKPSDSKPSDSKSAESKPSDGQPSESQPSEGPPSDGKPSEGQGKPSQSQGQPSQSGESGESSDSEPKPEEQTQSPSERAVQKLRQAQERMEQAEKKLKEAKRNDAVEEQEAALRELEQAKAELEKILRQLREEEMERMLVLLEARLRKMLEAQNQVYDETIKLEESTGHVPQHELEISSASLSRKEEQIIGEADRALVLLQEDGSSVAFPEALQQAREDMRTVADRLRRVKPDKITQGLEKDIIATLEETLAALQKALKDLRDKKASQQQGSGGEPGEQPLVDQLAELRMIRALQMRVNGRTEFYDKLIEGDQTQVAELLEALNKLAERQEHIFQATRDLHQGTNQ